MEKRQEHTATPYFIHDKNTSTDWGFTVADVDDNFKIVSAEPSESGNAEFIVRCCNSHALLVEACREAFSTINQLSFISGDKLSKLTLNKIEQALKQAEGGV